MQSGRFYVNNRPLIAVSEEEIENLFKSDYLKMYSKSGDKSFYESVYDETGIEELNGILDALGLKTEDESMSINCLMHRVCAQLEHNNIDLIVGGNFMIFIDHMDNVNFDLRRMARETLHQTPLKFLKTVM